MDNSDELIQSYLRHAEGATDATRWAWKKVNDLAREEPDAAFAVVLQLLHQAASREQLAYVAAGPLEDLLHHFGSRIIQLIDQELPTNSRLLYALSCVWADEDTPIAEYIDRAVREFGEEKLENASDLPPVAPRNGDP